MVSGLSAGERYRHGRAFLERLARLAVLFLNGGFLPALYQKVIVMIKHKSDPFLAQASVMLVIMLVMYALGGDSGNLDHLIAAR